VKVLVVDDLEANRLLLTHLVEQLGHSAIVSDSAVDAFAKYEAHGADMIFMDVVMPELDGYLAAKKLREMIGERFVPIIFITALQEEESLVQCLDYGDDFLVRPFNQAMFNAKVAAHTRTIQLHKKAQNQHKELNTLHTRLLQEQAMAQHVFEHAAQASNQTCKNIQTYLSSCSLFKGDVFLVAESPAGGAYVLLGDFTGHGLPAALGSLPLSQVFYSMVLKQVSVGDLAREINRVLVELLPSYMFCAAVIAEVNSKGDYIKLWTGGLHESFILDENSEIVEKVKSLHPPLGVLEDDEFNSRSVGFVLKPKDKVVIYTDGILEANNLQGEFFGSERFQQVLQQSECDFEKVVQEVDQFVGSHDEAKHDDISLICISADTIEFEAAESDLYENNRDAVPWEITMELGSPELKAGSPVSQLTDMIGEATGLFSHKPLLTILISEMFNNSLEHGILCLDSTVKKDMDGVTSYYSEREKRLEKLTVGHVSIRVQHEALDCGGKLLIEVRDSGDGFDFEAEQAKWNLLNEARREVRKAASTENGYGRGLSLINQLCESVDFTEQGSCISVVYRYIKN
jgi:serine phosphatase RsbU (regulator of sigma subunit)